MTFFTFKAFALLLAVAVTALSSPADAAAFVPRHHHVPSSSSASSSRTRSTGGGSGSSALGMTVLSYRGKKIDAKEGTPLSKAVARLGVKPKYNCKDGDCNSCQLSVGGRRMNPCIAKVPPMPRLKSLQEKGLEVK